MVSIIQKYKIPYKCHNHEVQPSQGTRRRRDEEPTKTHVKPTTHAQRRTDTEEPFEPLMVNYGAKSGSKWR